jgi:deoxyribodipyrimidine photolyase-related protein
MQAKQSKGTGSGMKKVGILFPHQLFRKHSMLEAVDAVYLVEEDLFFKQYAFHKQKIAFHRASMKALEKDLKAQKKTCHYIDATKQTADIRKLIETLSKDKQIEALHYIDVTDDWLGKRIKKQAERFEIQTEIYASPLFLNTREDLAHFFRKDKQYFLQTTFYKQQRKKRNVLIEKDDQPAGGKWSFDPENRKKYPKTKTPPDIQFPDQNSFWKEAVFHTNKHFKKNPGELSSSPIYPVTPDEAQTWFQQFLETRFRAFGDYEDAIVQEEPFLHHSLISPLLNTGLLHPQDVLDQALEYASDQDVPLNSTEGFIRQIMGWREFIRGMYECKGAEIRTTNFWDFNRKIPKSFYDGSTGIEPVDTVVKRVLKTGYCHHIERLMVLGNFMLLCEFDPDEVYRWFMELFIDAYDWVMVPNVYGMSQFADGGLFATKPYISGSNYLKKMSDYSTGPWRGVWDGLFWRFVANHQDFFQENPRLSMMFHSYKRMSDEKKKEHITRADEFFKKVLQ